MGKMVGNGKKFAISARFLPENTFQLFMDPEFISEKTVKGFFQLKVIFRSFLCQICTETVESQERIIIKNDAIKFLFSDLPLP